MCFNSSLLSPVAATVQSDCAVDGSADDLNITTTDRDIVLLRRGRRTDHSGERDRDQCPRRLSHWPVTVTGPLTVAPSVITTPFPTVVTVDPPGAVSASASD
jgi:hypothetical protein